MNKRGTIVGVFGLLTVAGLIGAACESNGAPTESAPIAHSTAGLSKSAGSGGNVIGAAPAASPRSDAVALETGVPALSQKIVKTANLVLTIKDGTFDDRFQQATQVAAGNGGFVSTSETSGGRRRSGTIVLRVPVGQFEAALGQLKSLGRVGSIDVGGQDVTSQFVDLQARLRNWQAQEAVLLKLMAKSTSIDDSIKVQGQLQEVQLNIEEITGQLRVLSDQTDYSTITLSIAEAGAAPRKPVPSTGLDHAWHQALHGSVAVLAAVVIGLGYLVPLFGFALFVALVWGAVQRARPRVISTP